MRFSILQLHQTCRAAALIAIAAAPIACGEGRNPSDSARVHVSLTDARGKGDPAYRCQLVIFVRTDDNRIEPADLLVAYASRRLDGLGGVGSEVRQQPRLLGLSADTQVRLPINRPIVLVVRSLVENTGWRVMEPTSADHTPHSEPNRTILRIPDLLTLPKLADHKDRAKILAAAESIPEVVAEK